MSISSILLEYFLSACRVDLWRCWRIHLIPTTACNVFSCDQRVLQGSWPASKLQSTSHQKSSLENIISILGRFWVPIHIGKYCRDIDLVLKVNQFCNKSAHKGCCKSGGERKRKFVFCFLTDCVGERYSDPGLLCIGWSGLTCIPSKNRSTEWVT